MARQCHQCFQCGPHPLLIPSMGNLEGVVVNVFDAVGVEEFVHFYSVAAAVGSWYGFPPTLFSCEDEAGFVLEMFLLFGDEEVGAEGVELIEGPVDGFGFIMELLEEHWCVPGCCIAKEFRIAKYEAECSPAAFAESEEESALGFSDCGIVLLVERDDEFLQVACLSSIGICGVIAVPWFFFESHLHDDDVVFVVSIHLPEYAETIAVSVVEAFFDGQHIQDTVEFVLSIVIGQENTDFLLAILVFGLDRVDPDIVSKCR